MRKLMATIAIIFLSNGIAFAENDMWNGYSKIRNLYTPHENFCDGSTEAFVAVGPNGDGFCIEKNERSSSEWEEAKQTCANLNKRLPEVAEFRYACTRAGALGLSNMTNNLEWISNESTPINYPGGSPYDGPGVSLSGLGSCSGASWTGPHDPRPFRCVR